MGTQAADAAFIQLQVLELSCGCAAPAQVGLGAVIDSIWG